MKHSLAAAENPANGFKGARIGALLLFDWTEEKASSGSAEGRLSPVLTAKVSQCGRISMRKHHASLLTVRVPQILA